MFCTSPFQDVTGAGCSHQEGQSIHRRSRKNKNGEHLSCVFCKNNGEASFIYSSQKFTLKRVLTAIGSVEMVVPWK